MQVLATETLNSIFDRTELRIKELHLFRQSLIHLNSFEDFSSLKLKFTQFFFDIEDDLRESFQSHKSAYLEIKELKDNLIVMVNRYEALESKSKYLEQYNKDLKSNIMEYLEQMKIKEEKINEFERRIKNLESENRALRALNLAEKENKNSQLNLTEENLHIPRNIELNYEGYENRENANKLYQITDINKINNKRNFVTENNESRKNRFPNFRNFNNNNTNSPINNSFDNNNNNNISSKSFDFSKKINNNNNQIKENIQKKVSIISEFDKEKIEKDKDKAKDSSLIKIKDNITNYQFSEILSERENSKKVINDYIKNSLNFNYTDDNFSNFNKIHDNFNTNLKEEKEKGYKKLEHKNFQYENNNENENIREIKSNLSSVNNSASKNFYISNMQSQDKNLTKNINISNLYTNNFDSEKKNKEIKDTPEKNKENLDKEEKENESFPEKNVPKFIESKKTNKKADRILDIVVKIRTVEDISAIIFHLFGDDVLDSILSANADEELIDKVEATIKEIERLIDKEYSETEPLQDPPRQFPQQSIIQEQEEESTFINNTLPNKENNQNLNQNSQFKNDIKIIKTCELDNENFRKNTEEEILSKNLAKKNLTNSQIKENFQNFLSNDTNKYNNNVDDVLSKNSYDIISENNLRRSYSKLRNSNTNRNNKSNSKPKRDKPKDETAAVVRLNFERNLRNYESNDNNISPINRSNTMGNMSNKKMFNNYVKNKGEVFDPYILRQTDPIYCDRKKSSSKTINRNGKQRQENQSNLDMNSIKEMQRFKELYQKFRFLAENDDNFTFINNTNKNNDLMDSDSKRGYIRKIKPIEKKENLDFEKYNENHNKKVYQFNDD